MKKRDEFLQEGESIIVVMSYTGAIGTLMWLAYECVLRI